MYKKAAKKPAPSLTKLFVRNLQQFVNGKLPCALFVHHPSLQKDPWLRAVSGDEAVLDCLRELHSCYKILPAPVLYILAKTRQIQSDRKKALPLKKNSRQRKTDIDTIATAIRVIETYSWKLSTDEELNKKRNALNYLETLKWAIKNVEPQKRQAEVEMRFAAQTLQQFFRAVSGRSLDECTGQLLVHALKWPRGQGDGDDHLRLAALQRAKGPQIVATRFTLREALDLQKQDYSYWRKYLTARPKTVRADGKGEKEFDRILKNFSHEFLL